MGQARNVTDNQHSSDKITMPVQQGRTVDHGNQLVPAGVTAFNLVLPDGFSFTQGFLQNPDTCLITLVGTVGKRLAGCQLEVTHFFGSLIRIYHVHPGIHGDNGILYTAEYRFQTAAMLLQLFFILLIFNCPGNYLSRRGQDVHILIYPFAVMPALVKPNKAIKFTFIEQRDIQSRLYCGSQQSLAIQLPGHILNILKIDDIAILKLP